MLEDTIQKERIKNRPDQISSAEELLENICQQHQISINQLTNYLNDPTQFDAIKWQEMQAFRQKLEDDLTCLLENISNPQETQNKYKELEKARSWIPMR